LPGDFGAVFEILCDPTDTAEDFTAELLSATDPLIYRDNSEELEALRAQIRAIGVKTVAREARVSRSRMQAFVNQSTTLQPATVARIKATLRALAARYIRNR